MKKEWFFDRFCGEQIVVYAEDGKIVEVGVENEGEGELVGNVYKGKVANIVAGMQAAFIAFGLERNGYLPLNDAETRFSKYDGEDKPAPALALKEGDELLVQVVKPPRGTKGAKLTTALSFVGKRLIFLPNSEFLGISRKITNEETRARLLDEAEKLRAKGQGFIVRTAAETAQKKQLKAESEYLKRIARSVAEGAENAPVGALVYRECELPVKVMRDSLGDGVTGIYVGDRELYEKILRLTKLRADLSEKKIVLYTGVRSMYSQYG